ncbi:hypothetical protein FHS26_001900 [Rhizobium pisi]|uniref:Uncharacterized protein n=1 Tax=Rhizobium pisi TaxID=574561 RepID=A0A7W5BK30_9HYPH|nr:hypothetical protein [Rhizobium pisi]
MIDALTAADAHIAFDVAATGKIGKWSGHICDFDAEVPDDTSPDDS